MARNSLVPTRRRCATLLAGSWSAHSDLTFSTQPGLQFLSSRWRRIQALIRKYDCATLARLLDSSYGCFGDDQNGDLKFT